MELSLPRQKIGRDVSSVEARDLFNRPSSVYQEHMAGQCHTDLILFSAPLTAVSAVCALILYRNPKEVRYRRYSSRRCSKF